MPMIKTWNECRRGQKSVSWAAWMDFCWPDPVRRGLELAASDLFLQRLQNTIDNRSPRILAVLTDVRAFQGVDGSDKIHALWSLADEDVQTATVRLARNSSKDMASYVAQLGLEMEQPEIRVEAMELGLMAGVDKAWNVALSMAARASTKGCCRPFRWRTCGAMHCLPWDSPVPLLRPRCVPPP